MFVVFFLLFLTPDQRVAPPHTRIGAVGVTVARCWLPQPDVQGLSKLSLATLGLALNKVRAQVLARVGEMTRRARIPPREDVLPAPSSFRRDQDQTVSSSRVGRTVRPV